MIFSENSLKIIKIICDYEDLNSRDVIEYLYKFQDIIKNSIKIYSNTKGLSDYKMQSHDFLILLFLCMNTKKNECKIDLQGSSVLMKGPGIIDYFKSKIICNG